ncbi:hypothetical protein CCICO_08880 [Corynebacterium ciconiae DSM 44920]|uniref:hypothetical protein n=1 Tax=Corynebacterium ciconiae TaxID=227319 RepID=UPI0003635E6F|nr:hypothetical protein [Corynebacterium ciconiae]WKD61784.1 hypothetical protein CCICO_08880 [Corynebacterium ciconiae DSM 44920]
MPAPIRWAAILGGIEGLAGIGYGLFLIIRDVLGYRDDSAVFEDELRADLLGFGTGVVFLIFFGAVFAAAIVLARGKRWGRAPILMLNMLLIPIAFYIHGGGHTPLAIAVGIVGFIGLGLLFNGVAVRWAASQY